MTVIIYGGGYSFSPKLKSFKGVFIKLIGGGVRFNCVWLGVNLCRQRNEIRGEKRNWGDSLAHLLSVFFYFDSLWPLMAIDAFMYMSFEFPK